MKLKSWLAAGLVVAATLVGSVAPSFAAGRDLAVLVVGRGNDKDMAARERAVIETLTRLRVQRGWNHKLLPIYSYHFDKSAEKSYCEDRLKVKQGDLIVVGLVELESGVPVDFVYRENDVSTPEPVADKVMDRARAELAARGRLASTTPPPASTSTPTHPPTTTRPTPVRPASPSTPAAPVAVKSPAAPATRPVSTPSAPVTTAPSTPAVKPPNTTVKLTPAPPLKTPAPVVKTPAPVVKHTPAPPVAVNPATTKPAETPVTEGNEKYIVQLGLFSTLDKARTFIAKLKETNPDVQVEIRKGTKDGQVVFRVVVEGLYPTSADAAARAKALTEAGVQAFRTKFDPTVFGTVVK